LTAVLIIIVAASAVAADCGATFDYFSIVDDDYFVTAVFAAAVV
jgi:hypothetical protein